MRVRVTFVFVPAGSTIGIGAGVPENDATKVVEFAGDWRMMADMALAAESAEAEGEPLVVDIPDWAIFPNIRELP